MSNLLVNIPWDVEEYYSVTVKGKKAKGKLAFPKLSLGAFSEPLTIVDAKGRIVLWYLPGLLCSELQASIQSYQTSQDSH